MSTIQQQDSAQLKQRLRAEISNHVQDFLHKGGRIEVVTVLSHCSNQARVGRRPHATALGLMPNLLDD